MPRDDLPQKRPPTAPPSAPQSREWSGLADVEVRVTVELGRTELPLGKASALTSGSKLRVDKEAGEPVDIRVNGKLFGRGKLVVVGDSYGVQVTEIFGQ